MGNKIEDKNICAMVREGEAEMANNQAIIDAAATAVDDSALIEAARDYTEWTIAVGVGPACRQEAISIAAARKRLHAAARVFAAKSRQGETS